MSDDYEVERDYPDQCKICGADMEWSDCWRCSGEGACDDGGEDAADPTCFECKGEGGYLECSALPHSEEQMVAYRANKGGEPR